MSKIGRMFNWRNEETKLTFPRATDKKTAPLPESHALRKLSSAIVVSTTSFVSMNTSFDLVSCLMIPIPSHSLMIDSM